VTAIFDIGGPTQSHLGAVVKKHNLPKVVHPEPHSLMCLAQVQGKVLHLNQLY
jgi:hypothetical protein